MVSIHSDEHSPPRPHKFSPRRYVCACNDTVFLKSMKSKDSEFCKTSVPKRRAGRYPLLLEKEKEHSPRTQLSAQVSEASQVYTEGSETPAARNFYSSCDQNATEQRIPERLGTATSACDEGSGDERPVQAAGVQWGAARAGRRRYRARPGLCV